MQIYCVAFSLILRLLPLSGGQDSIADLGQFLKEKYQGKVVTLRHFYAGPALVFDANGTLSSRAVEGPWTTCARVEVEELNLSEKTLTLQGRRLLFQFDRGTRSFLDIGGNPQHKNSIMLSNLRDALRFRAEVAIEKGAGRGDTLQAAMDRIFLTNTERLVDVAPRFWKLFLRREAPPEKAEINAWFHAAGVDLHAFETPGLVEPREVRRSLPSYTELARIAVANGVIAMIGVIDVQGKVNDPQIIIPMGLGLDEAAVSEVAKWQFEPGQLNGWPVAVLAPFETVFKLR